MTIIGNKTLFTTVNDQTYKITSQHHKLVAQLELDHQEADILNDYDFQ